LPIQIVWRDEVSAASVEAIQSYLEIIRRKVTADVHVMSHMERTYKATHEERALAFA
jgi:hypothetical protein